MADLALVTADKLNVGSSGPNTQHTFIAGGTNISAGTPVYQSGTNGMVFAAKDGAGTNYTGVWGIATLTAKQGTAVTVIRKGFVDGLNVASLDLGTKLYLSTTAGKIADAAPGTTNAGIKVLGEVVPAFNCPIGSTDRLVYIDVT